MDIVPGWQEWRRQQFKCCYGLLLFYSDIPESLFLQEYYSLLAWEQWEVVGE